jgi:hypothetical protein
MSALLFKLRGVPEDEADEVRELLERNGVDFYETPPGNWGISAPGFWVRDKANLARGKALIEDYQHERARCMRADYERRRRAGEVDTLLDRARRHPFQTLLVVVIAAVVLYFSTVPFLGLGITATLPSRPFGRLVLGRRKKRLPPEGHDRVCAE